MQITNQPIPAQPVSADTSVSAASDPSGVVIPYNAPTTNDFEQVLRSLSTPPASSQAPAPAAATSTAPAATPGAAAVAGPSIGMPVAPAPTSAPSTTGMPAAMSPYGAMMPAMYVPVMMMPVGMMPAGGAATGMSSPSTVGVPAAATPAAATPAAAAAAGTTALATPAGAGTPAMAAAPMPMAMMPMAMVPMGMMPMAAAGAVTPGAAPVMPSTATATSLATDAAGASTVGAAAPAAASGATFQLPFQGSAPVTQPFGPTSYAAEPSYDGYSHFHTGTDYGVPMGTHIDAAGAGRVVAAGWDDSGFGNRVIVDHGNGLQTLYGHLSTVEVGVGQTVQAGQEIGLSGSTGNSSGPHLHFGVEKGGQWVDPAPYLSAPPTPATATSAPAPAPAASTIAGGPGAIGGGTATDAASATSLPALIGQVAAQTGVPASLISAVVQTESAGDPHAVSSAGAKGLMQLMDGTAASYGVTDVFDPRQNVTAGAKYLANLLRQFNGNQQLAVAAYNAGPGAVQQYGGIPPYPETQAYVQKVTALQQQFAARK